MSRVPDEIMRRLHEANERFHSSRLRLDEVGNSGFSEQRDAWKAVRAAEQDLEDVTREIDSVMTGGDRTVPTIALEQNRPDRGVYRQSERAAATDLPQRVAGGTSRYVAGPRSGAAHGPGAAMAKDMFHHREQAEEAVYFSQQDARLIETLRERARLGEIARALAEKLKVDDPALLDRIVKLGVTIDTGAAFILAPLVEVAWADGQVDEAERHAILRLAQDRGVMPGSGDMSQLLQWMSVRPPGALFQAAFEAIEVGLSVLPVDESEQRVENMIDACEQVARSSGGLAKLLRLSSGVSPDEQSTLNEIRARLTSRPRAS
jgi:hypothetical protein